MRVTNMRFFDWLCGCDSPHRDEAQYITGDCNGVYVEKKPIICTEQPKSTEQTNKVPNGIVQPKKPVTNGHLENGHPVANGKPMVNNVNKTISSDDFLVPNFKLIENDVQGYRILVAEVRSIMSDRQLRLEQLIDRKHLPNEVDEDVRAARGKIIVIVKNNLSTFDKLLKDATDEPQQVADLTGFWSIIHKELKDVQRACERVEASRLNQWKYVPRPITPPPSLPPSTPSVNSRTTKPKSGQQTPARTPKTNPNLRAFMAQKRKEMQSNETLAD